MMSSWARAKTFLMETSEVLQRSIASSLIMREAQSFTLSISTPLLDRTTNIQPDGSLQTMSRTEMFSHLSKSSMLPVLKRSDSSPLKIPRPRTEMFLPVARSLDFTTAPPAIYSVWLSESFISSGVCTPAPKYTTFLSPAFGASFSSGLPKITSGMLRSSRITTALNGGFATSKTILLFSETFAFMRFGNNSALSRGLADFTVISASRSKSNIAK